MTLTNPGTGPLRFAGVDISGTPDTRGPWRVGTITCPQDARGYVLAPGQQCTVATVSFAPTSAGTAVNTLRLVDAARRTVGTSQVALVGVARAATAPAGAATPTPQSARTAPPSTAPTEAGGTDGESTTGTGRHPP